MRHREEAALSRPFLVPGLPNELQPTRNVVGNVKDGHRGLCRDCIMIMAPLQVLAYDLRPFCFKKY